MTELKLWSKNRDQNAADNKAGIVWTTKQTKYFYRETNFIILGILSDYN